MNDVQLVASGDRRHIRIRLC